MAQIILDSNNNLIQGDFDNATVNNRTKFKTTTADATTNVYAVPNGSATSAGFSVSNAADPTNASKITIATNGSTDVQVISGVNGSGSYLPMSFYTNNALAAQISTAGNLTVTGTITATGGFVGAGNPAGTIIQFAGTSAPTGYLLCPTSLTNISRTTYATLFAAIGTTWGSGDGSTTFGLPWFTADFAPVQASANVGTTTTGSVIAHTHTFTTGTNTGSTGPYANASNANITATTNSTGGTNNLAAGARVLFCIKY